MMGIADINGTLINTENDVIDISDRDYFQKAVKGTNAISDPVISKADKSMVLECSVKLLEVIAEKYGNPRIAVIGLQPAMVE